MKNFCVQFNGDVWFYDNRDDAFVQACRLAVNSFSHGYIYVFDETDCNHDCILSYEVVV